MAGLDHAFLPGNNGKLRHAPWSYEPTSAELRLGKIRPFLTVALMAALLAFDVLAGPPVAVGVLYGLAIYLIAADRRLDRLILVAAGSAILTVLGFVLAGRSPGGDPLFRLIYGLGLQTLLFGIILRSMRISHTLLNQAKLLDQTHDSVVVRRLDATLLYWNRGATDLFGWTFEQAREHSQAALIGTGTVLPPMTIEAFIAHGPWRGEIEVKAKDGRRMVIDCHCSLMLDERDRPYAILTTGNDVTARHDAQEKLERSEMRYRNVFQTTGIAIFECDFSAIRRQVTAFYKAGGGDLLTHLRNDSSAVRTAIRSVVCNDVNEAAIRMFNATSKEDLLGSHDWLWPRETEAQYAESIMAAVEMRTIWEDEVTLNTVDGQKIDCFLSVAFPPESASRESVFVTATDISTRTAANTALRMAQADLAHASRLASLGELAASIAHEVKQPVAGILANGQAGVRWLERETPNLAKVGYSLKGVIDEAKRADAIITGIRALAKNEMPNPTLFSLPELIDEALRLVTHELGRTGIVVATEIDRFLPDISADRIQIQQVLINLILNASQAMVSNAVDTRRMTISLSRNASCATVMVADTGPGVSDEARKGLFTAFNTSRADGMGLGLSICASIIRRHEGQIWLAPSSEGGARFVFTLPFPSDGTHKPETTSAAGFPAVPDPETGRD